MTETAAPEVGVVGVASDRAADAELAARFSAETAPIVEALARRARRLSQSDADAEDLLQDTLLHAYQGFRSFRQGTNLNAWLFRILQNRWVSRHRHRECRPTEVPLEDSLGGGAHCHAVERSAEVEVLDVLPDGDVLAAFSALPVGIRTAIYYVGVEGYTHAETAELMDVPIGTVMSRVSRGRQRLRVALAHLGRDRGECAHDEQRTA